MNITGRESRNFSIHLPSFDCQIGLLLAETRCGFPSPAQDYIENKLDLNEYLIKHPSATFYARAKGSSMTEAGIFDGDLLIIDRAEKPSNNKIVLAVIDGEFTVKKIQLSEGKIYLIPNNPEYTPIEITEQMDFKVWGVVRYVIHKLR